MIHRNEKICPRCDAPTMKNWTELSDEEKDMIQRLAGEVPSPQTKKHRFCTRCWFEEVETLTIA